MTLATPSQAPACSLPGYQEPEIAPRIEAGLLELSKDRGISPAVGEACALAASVVSGMRTFNTLRANTGPECFRPGLIAQVSKANSAIDALGTVQGLEGEVAERVRYFCQVAKFAMGEIHEVGSEVGYSGLIPLNQVLAQGSDLSKLARKGQVALPKAS
jgi:hypothetical protein